MVLDPPPLEKRRQGIAPVPEITMKGAGANAAFILPKTPGREELFGKSSPSRTLPFKNFCSSLAPNIRYRHLR